MSNNNLTLDLLPRKDKDGKIFFIAKLKAPVLLDARDGIVFLAFVSDSGAEQLQIACMSKEPHD